ncbi:beta-carotene 15,15'-dioxygenase-domain-containing protein [Gorgonomyces haynaldii]|nr:beta-carotene 15,15'-dioxygenase-domain-containing protein [Gorgonomyces haynaldii]
MLGIPHGALDLELFYIINHSRSLKNTLAVGYINYFIIMALWVLAWAFVPTIAFWTFMAVSAYHFGESDLDYIQIRSLFHRSLLFFSRGVLLIGLTMTSQPNLTTPIIKHLIPLEEQSFTEALKSIPPLVIAQHMFVLSNLAHLATDGKTHSFPVYTTRPDTTVFMTEIAKSFMYCTLFFTTGPLVGFAVFFGLWHSLPCIVADLAYFRQIDNPWFGKAHNAAISWRDVGRFYVLAMPYTVAGMLTMVLAYYLAINSKFALDLSHLWALFVVGVSVLTGAHVWIVACLHFTQVHLDPFRISSIFT